MILRVGRGRRRGRVAACVGAWVGALAVGLLVGCSPASGDDPGGDAAPSTSATSTSATTTTPTSTAPTTSAPTSSGTTAKDPAAELEAAADAFARTTGASIEITSADVPARARGLQALIGTGTGTPTKAFRGTATALVDNTFPGTLQVTAVDDVVRVRYFTQGYVAANPAQFKAPNPADLFSATRGIGVLADSLESVRAGSAATVDGERVRVFTGTLPGGVLARVTALGTTGTDYPVTVHLSEDGAELRRVVVTGPIYADASSTFTVTLRDYGQQPTITLPPVSR